MIRFLKGIIVGIGGVAPGLSGSVLLIIFGLYQKTLETLGSLFQDFKNKGRFGCPKCYETFRMPVTSTLKQIHQNVKHTGKIPAGSAAELKKKKRYEELKAELTRAVNEEDYEKAAKLHKELKSLGDINN